MITPRTMFDGGVGNSPARIAKAGNIRQHQKEERSARGNQRLVKAPSAWALRSRLANPVRYLRCARSGTLRQMLTRIALPGPTFSMPPMRSALGARDMLRMQSTNLALEGIGTLSPRWLRFCGIAFTGNKAHRNRFQRSRRTAAFRDNCPPYGKYSSALLASRSCARPHTRAHQRRPRARVRSHLAYRS